MLIHPTKFSYELIVPLHILKNAFIRGANYCCCRMSAAISRDSLLLCIMKAIECDDGLHACVCKSGQF